MLRFPPRRIMVAVDPSRVSLRAYRAAKTLAERYGAALECVYCEAPLPPELSAYGVAGGARGRQVAAELQKRLDGASVRVVPGEPARLLPRLSRSCDLLVLGTHRRRGAARLLLGSVAAAAVRDAVCPVLVVPTSLKPIRAVLAPINEEDYARRGLLAAGLVARAHRARLTVLHVVTDPIFGMSPSRLLKKRIAELPDDVRHEVHPVGETAQSNVVGEILRASRGRQLVVMTAHRKSLLGDLVLGTTAERVVRLSRVPVLTVPAR